jgi:hypothetical protein
MTNAPGYELFLSDFQIVADSNANEFCKGLVVNSGDGHFSNGTSVFTPIGTEVVGASNIFDKIHCWSGYYANGKDSGDSGGREQFIGFHINAANNQFNHCQSDSPSKRDYSQGNLDGISGYVNGGIGFYLSAAAYRCKLIACTLVSNTTLYTNAASVDSRPLTDQILPIANNGGKDNAFIGFRSEVKTETRAALFSSAENRTRNTIVGCDGESNNIMSRSSGLAALTISAENDDTAIDFKYDGITVGGVDVPNNFQTVYRGASQLKFTLDDQTHTPAGLRYTTFAASGSERFQHLGDGVCALGQSGNRWSVIYAATGTINTSDDREKTYLDITEVEKAVALELKQNMRKFKWNDAVEVKGEDARIHFGTSAQTVKSIFEKHGLVAENYGLLCYDEWEQEVDEEGNVIVEAGNRYGIRYEELLCFIMSAI